MYKEMGIDYAKRGNAKKVSLNNGEVLDYRETVEGEKILLLVHGNMISSKHWDILTDKLPIFK